MDGCNMEMDTARPELTEAEEPSGENVSQWPTWSWSPSQGRMYPQRPIQKCSWGPYQTPSASNWPWTSGMTGPVGYNPRIRMSWGSIGQYPAGRSDATEGKFSSGKIMKSKRKKMSASKRRALKKKRLLLNSSGDSGLSTNICFSTTNSISTRSSSPVRSSSRASTNRWSRSPSPINFHEEALVPNANRSRSLSPTIFPITNLGNKAKSSPPIFMHLSSINDSKMMYNVKPKSRSVLDIFLQSLPDNHNFYREVPMNDIHQSVPENVRVKDVKSHQKKIFLNRSPLHFNNTSTALPQSRSFVNHGSFTNEVSTHCDKSALVRQNEDTVMAEELSGKDGSDDKTLEESSDQEKGRSENKSLEESSDQEKSGSVDKRLEESPDQEKYGSEDKSLEDSSDQAKDGSEDRNLEESSDQEKSGSEDKSLEESSDQVRYGSEDKSLEESSDQAKDGSENKSLDESSDQEKDVSENKSLEESSNQEKDRSEDKSLEEAYDQEIGRSEDKSLEESSDQITCLVNSDEEFNLKGMKQLSFKNNIASSDLATPPVTENIRQWNFSPVPFPPLSDDSLPWNTSPLPFITPIGSFSDNHMESVESPQVLAHVFHSNDSLVSGPSSVTDSQNNELEKENELSKKTEFNITESQHLDSLSLDSDRLEHESPTEITSQSETRRKMSISDQNSMDDGNSLETLSLLGNNIPLPCDKLHRENVQMKSLSNDKPANFPTSGLSFNQHPSNEVSVKSEKHTVPSERESQSSSVRASLGHKPLTEQMMLVQESESCNSNFAGSEKVIEEQPNSIDSEKFAHTTENLELSSHSGPKGMSTNPDRDFMPRTAFKDWSLSPNIPSESPCLLSPKSPSSDSSDAQVDIYELMSPNVDVKSPSSSQSSGNRSPSPNNMDEPSRSPSPSSEGGCIRSRSPTPSPEGSEARSRSPSSSSQSNTRSRSLSRSSERSDSRSRSSSPSTEGSDIRSRSTSSSSEETGVRSRSPSPLSQSSYVRSRSPSPASERIDTRSRSTFSSPERSFTTFVTQSIEEISRPQENMQSILEPKGQDMAVKRVADEVKELKNSSHNLHEISNLLKNYQCLEEPRNVELEKSSLVERPLSPGNESVHPNINLNSYMESENSFVPELSSLTPITLTDSLKVDNGTRFENSACGNRLSSSHSAPTSLKLSDKESVDLLFSMEKNIPADSNSVEKELKPNGVSDATVSYMTEDVSMNSSIPDAPMNLSKDTNDNSTLASSEKLDAPEPGTERLSDKNDYRSPAANVSETISAIHSASVFQEEARCTKEKQDVFSKIEEATDMTESSPSDICEFNNASNTNEYSPTTNVYLSVKNSPISFCNSPPSPSSDEDMSTESNDDSSEFVTKSNLKFNREIILHTEQNTSEICKQGLKRSRSSSPETVHRSTYSLSPVLRNISSESEDQTPSCQKRLKFSSSGGRLLMNKQACKLFAAQDSKKQVFKRQKSMRGVLLELYEGSGHKGIFTPKLYHQKRRLRTIATRSSAKKLKRRTPNHDLKYISQKRMDLIKAVEEGRMPKVQELIQDMGPVLREEKTGSTLLHVAVAHNQVDVVLFLLGLINPNVVNSEGETPAHLAAFMGHTQILRILLTDEELCHEKKNRQGRTYTNLLSAPLCDAVLGKDRSKVLELLKLGADPDYDVGDVVKGQLPPDVRVSTPRQLATDLGVQDILQIFPKKIPDVIKKVREPDVVFSTNSIIPNSDEGKHYPDPVAIEVTSSQEPPKGDVYPVNTEPRGFVCILDYNTFRDRQDLDLEGSMQDISNLSSVFSKMGYAGEVYSSPTADETTEILRSVRNKEILKEVGCLVVVVNSHGVGEDRFLTSDLKLMDISRTCGLFKDSDCTHMANKPKIFLFNTGSGLYRESKKGRYIKPLATRVSEPLRDALCLFSSNSGFASWACSDKGTPFYLAFCNTLAKHAHSMEINDLFREFLKEYAKSSPVTVPELRNIGFFKKFFFNPVL